MNIVIIGGGPAGLYLALLLKRADPQRRVTVLERNAPDDTFGWGVVFSDQTLAGFRAADAPTHDAIVEHFAHWDDIDIHVHGRVITSGGHGFSGIARRTLLQILQRRCEELGVDLRFRCEVPTLDALESLGLGDADLIVGADGVNSMVRRTHEAAFHPSYDLRSTRYVWLGTSRPFDAFTFLFAEHAGGVFQAHAYRFEEGLSAFIVECDEASWKAAGMEHADDVKTLNLCMQLFGKWLEGHTLEFNAHHRRHDPWMRFLRVGCERWFTDRIVLLGDAAHTAHFSIGSGTKLAMEDAIALARALDMKLPRAEALQRYQDERATEVARIQNAARNSMEWFENVRRYIKLDAEQFAYSLLTRSQRVSHENLRLRDGAYLEGMERWFAARAEAPSRGSGAPPPPMFTPFSLRGMTVVNRVVVSPMDMYSATDGTPNDFHLAHLGARALGGAGLILTEMTCVSPEARISIGCTGMYNAEHVAAWTRIVNMVHAWSPAKICLQLGHSGRKGSTKKMWEGNEEPLDDGNWEVLAPSAEPYAEGMQRPRAMTRADMDAVRDQFVRATRMGAECGFDMLELHCAHGYLLSSFITPIGNRRTDEYGGSLENRMRFPLEVFRAMRAEWPAAKPMSVRISATDWVEGGVDGGESVQIARMLADAGADIIHVSTGQTSPDAKPVYGRMWQTPFSDRIRQEAGVLTIAVGNITEADQVNAIIAAGRADLCALGRPHLADPQWTLRAAAQLGYEEQWWPVQYRSGKAPFERAFVRAAEQRENELRMARLESRRSTDDAEEFAR